jgi:hypothetical protein
MARAKGIAEENPGGRLTTKTSQYASPSISIAWCINGRQAEASRTSAFICALPTRSAAALTDVTNLACASPSASMYLLVVVRLACPAAHIYSIGQDGVLFRSAAIFQRSAKA